MLYSECIQGVKGDPNQLVYGYCMGYDVFVSSSVHGFTTTLLNVSEGDPLQRIEVSLDIKGNTFREPAPATESFGLQVRCIDSGGPQTVSES